MGESRAECVGEQVVVAVPLARRIKGNDEQVASLESFQRLLPVGAAGQCVTQRAAQLSQYGGVEEELARLVRLAAQYLFHEIVEDEAVAAGERLDEGSRIVLTAH